MLINETLQTRFPLILPVMIYFQTNPSWLIRHTEPSAAGKEISNKEAVRSTVILATCSAEQISEAFRAVAVAANSPVAAWYSF